MGIETDFLGLKLKNPVFAASGIIGYGEEYSELFDINLLGGIITKTITLHPRKGNPMPRIAETSSGMINSIGLENPGVDKFIEEKTPYISKKITTAVFVSIGGETPEEFVQVIEKLNAIKCISALELNLSCPNVGLSRGLGLISQNPVDSFKAVRKAKELSVFPVMAKLSPAVTDITQIAIACEEAGAGALSLINTVPGMHYDKSLKTAITGGLSGPAIKPAALRAVHSVSKKVKIPVMGAGGICTARDAREFFDAGATVIAVGSGMFRNPSLPLEIIKELKGGSRG
ncbi:MAG: dihydroorotate dehydrogenase B catalytic subunit [Elusimicrobia bacterium RIFOXYB2_FULL_48_7]|nr:MAG: dihydroorotate dehydrogenase B catalytic subunit [Elusimicrobia bacterium RIFOXYB2_FULL_48_7]